MDSLTLEVRTANKSTLNKDVEFSNIITIFLFYLAPFKKKYVDKSCHKSQSNTSESMNISDLI